MKLRQGQYHYSTEGVTVSDINKTTALNVTGQGGPDPKDPPDTAFVHDGYEQTDHIPAKKGMNPAITWTYRPALFSERVRYRDAQGPEQRAEEGYRIIHGHIVSWSLPQRCDRIGTIRALRPHLIDHMLHLILQYGEPTKKPDGDTGPSQEELDAKN